MNNCRYRFNVNYCVYVDDDDVGHLRTHRIFRLSQYLLDVMLFGLMPNLDCRLPTEHFVVFEPPKENFDVLNAA